MAAPLTLRTYEEADLDWLGRMNRALYDDSGARSALAHEAYVARFRARAAEGYAIEVFERGAERVGFASHQPRALPDGAPYTYLAQFHVAREHRRRGLGREAFRLLASTRWPAGGRIALDVLEANGPGQAFWRSLGFCPYATTLDLTLPPELAP